jgi:cytidyltransferase-like protein
MATIVVVSGGFDPVHKGHIALFEEAKKLGDKLIVALNSDKWLARKKGRSFMMYEERALILRNLKMVDDVLAFNDKDDTAIDALRRVRDHYPNDAIVFANGGDRSAGNTPEQSVPDIEFVFGVGGVEKKNSSSQLVRNFRFGMCYTDYGYYNVVYQDSNCRVKEVSLEPSHAMTLGRHMKKSEFWFVMNGSCTVDYAWEESLGNINSRELDAHQHFYVPMGQFHALRNDSKRKACKLMVIEYGNAMKADEFDFQSIDEYGELFA